MKPERRAQKFILHHWWTYVIWKMLIWTKHQKYKGRVVLRGEIVKDDSGSYAVFTEQGSSASHMTAAEVMDIISRLPGCAGQAAECSICLHPSKNERRSKIIKSFPCQNVEIYGHVFHDTNGPNHGQTFEDPVVPLEWKLYGHPLAGLLWERQFEEVLMELGWEEVAEFGMLVRSSETADSEIRRRDSVVLLEHQLDCNRKHSSKKFLGELGWESSKLGMLVRSSETRIILNGIRGWYQNGWKNRMWLPGGRNRWGLLILENRHHFLTMCILGCTQRECKPTKLLLTSTKNVRITKFLLEQLKNFQGGRNLTQKLSRGLTTWQVLRKSALKDVVSWRTRRHGSCTKSQLCAWMITISWKRNWNQLENCRKYAHKLSWNACTWHELVDLAFYGQWINLHDRLQNGPKPVTNAWIDLFHTIIAHVNTDNVVMWVILLNNADWDCCKIPTLQEILRTENPLLEEHCTFLEVIHLFR